MTERTKCVLEVICDRQIPFLLLIF